MTRTGVGANRIRGRTKILHGRGLLGGSSCATAEGSGGEIAAEVWRCDNRSCRLAAMMAGRLQKVQIK